MMILMDCKCNNYLQYYYKFVVFIGGICDNIKQELFTVPKGSERITHTPGQLVTWCWASWTLLRCRNLIIKNFMTEYPRMWHYEAETRSTVEQSVSDSLQISFGPADVRDFSVILADVRCVKYPLQHPKVHFRVTKARRRILSWTRRIRSISTPLSLYILFTVLYLYSHFC